MPFDVYNQDVCYSVDVFMMVTIMMDVILWMPSDVYNQDVCYSVDVFLMVTIRMDVILWMPYWSKPNRLERKSVVFGPYWS